MVLFHMKSCDDRDEYLYSALTTKSTTEIRDELVFIHNARVRLRSQTLSIYNLLYENDGEHTKNKSEDTKETLKEIHEAAGYITKPDRVKERVIVGKDELSAMIEKIEAFAREVFPECKDTPEITAIDSLWKKRDDADISEDDRLRAWYFLELIDPAFKERDFFDPEKTSLWWAGKQIKPDHVLKDFTGANEKSKIVAKLQTAEKGCPSREQRLKYEDQRSLREHFHERKETFKQLEPSELANHKNVTRKPGDFVRFSAPTSNGTAMFSTNIKNNAGLTSLNTNVRTIHNPGKVETVVEESG
eukprot:TRINITY_DN34862_c0_g1_i1.p1 TRINITY_DN34862_c0_g1~~TRINITY_DN34862_c0_g1_i1.p1  ORF type:complete len:302 (+),score=65.47 TRINITY_DN34862_c0_g1_i1:49-954(+)